MDILRKSKFTKIVQMYLFVVIFLVIFCCEESAVLEPTVVKPTLSFCSSASLQGPYSPVTLDGSSDAIARQVTAIDGTSRCKCKIQAANADVGAMSISLQTNSEVKDCGKWIEIVKDGEMIANRFGCVNDTIEVTDIASGTGFTATLFVEAMVNSSATYQLSVQPDRKVELIVSCDLPVMGQATLPTASITNTSTASTTTSTSVTTPTTTATSETTLTSTSGTTPTSTNKTTHALSDGSDNTVVLVAVMVVVGVIVVVFIIVILICINRRLTNRPVEEAEPSTRRPRVFKRVHTRITHMYDSIKASHILPKLPASRRPGPGMSATMPLPKLPLESNPSGLYDSIKSNTGRRLGTRGQRLPPRPNMNRLADKNTKVNAVVSNQPSNDDSDKYYIHAEIIHQNIGDSDAVTKSEQEQCQENIEQPGQSNDAGGYMAMNLSTESANVYVNPVLKEKSVKYVNYTDAGIGLKTKDGSANNDNITEDVNQIHVEDTSIYLSMDNATAGVNDEQAESETKYMYNTDECPDYIAHAPTAGGDTAVNIDYNSPAEAETGTHCYTNTPVETDTLGPKDVMGVVRQ